MRAAICLLTAGALLLAMAPSWAARRALQAPAAEFEDTVLLAGDGCPADDAFGGMPIRQVDVRTPFTFLPWIQSDLNKAKAIAAPLVGTPYGAEQVGAVRAQIGALPFAQINRNARVGGRVLAMTVACQPQGLDLVFLVAAVNTSMSFAVTWEAQQRETAAPEQQAGQEALRNGLRLQPRLGYQAGEGLGLGVAALHQRSGAAADAIWQTLAVDAYRSARLHDVSLALEGSRDPRHGSWARLAWRLAYADQSAPANAVSRLDWRGAQALLLAQTRPLGALALPVRLGVALDLGQHRSGGQASPTSGLLAKQHTQSLKLMTGSTARLDRQSLAANYAVEFGAGSGGARRVDWVKHIVDVAHQGRWMVADHRSLSLDSRFTAGDITQRGPMPDGARFYAGGRAHNFTGGQEWQIRAAPLLRSLGTNALAGVGTSPGYRRFAALNLTVAMPVHNTPLMPAELYQNPEILPLMHSQLRSAASILASSMRSDLPSYRQAMAHLPQVVDTLAELSSAVASVRPPEGSAGSDAYTSCQLQVAQARSDVTGVLGVTGVEQVGLFTDLLPLPQGSDTLGQVVALCADSFNAGAGANSPPIARLTAALSQSIQQLEQSFAAASPEAAERAALREIEPVRRIVDTLFKEVNIVAVSPLLMLDLVRVGPRLDATPRTRVGLGTGLRVTLVDSVDFSLGYMANLRRPVGLPGQAREARGAVFVAMEFKDPF